MKDTLTIALSKGKLLEPALDLFKRVGLAPKDISPESRRLIFEHQASGTTLMIVRQDRVTAARCQRVCPSPRVG